MAFTITNDNSTNIEIEMLLVDLPMDVIKENVKSQIYSNAVNVNYLNVVSDKLRLIEEQFGDDSDIKMRVNDVRNEFFREIIQIIEERFDMYVNIDYDMPVRTEEIAMDLYEFFIVEMRRNAHKFVLNYIKENKKEIVEVLDLSKPKKDVTTSAIRKKLKSTDVKIISNLYEVADYIVGLEIDDMEFLNLTRNTSVANMYSSFTISGAVASEFLSFVRENNIVQNIVPDIQVKLIGK